MFGRRMIFLICSLFVVFVLLGVGKTPLPARAEQESEPLVTIIFFEMELREALRELALQTGVNIVMDENITGTVTLELEDTPLEKALQMILAGGGFSYRKVDDYYLVGLADPKNRIFADLAETEFYFFKNTKVSTVEALLPEAFRQNVRFDPETNVAAVTAPRGLRERIIADFKKIDIPRAQVRVRALVSEVQTEVIRNGNRPFNWELLPVWPKNGLTQFLDCSGAIEWNRCFWPVHTKIGPWKRGDAKNHADPWCRGGRKTRPLHWERAVLILDVLRLYDGGEG